MVLEIVQNHMIFKSFLKNFNFKLQKTSSLFSLTGRYDRNERYWRVHIHRTVFYRWSWSCDMDASLLALSRQTLLKFACQHFGRHHHHHRGAHAEIKVKATIIRHKNNNKIIKIKFEFEIDNFCSSWNGFSFQNRFRAAQFVTADTFGGTRHGLHLQHGHPPPFCPAPSWSAVLWQNAQWCEILTDCAPFDKWSKS